MSKKAVCLMWTFCLALFVFSGCTSEGEDDLPDTDVVEEDVDSDGDDDADSDDPEPGTGEICPQDGSFDHLGSGECTDGGQASIACPAGYVCLAADHCVGQGGADGAPTQCRIVNCGIVDCGTGCECVDAGVCQCPAE